MKKIILLASCIFYISYAGAQETKEKPVLDKPASKKEERRQRINALIRQEEEGVIAYRKHTLFGFKLTTDGYGGFVEVGRGQSVKRALLFQLDISERKHTKEEKQQGPYGTTPLIYGKINFFYPVKLGVQQQFLLGNKGNKNGVSMTGNAGGGLALGFLRPYLVEVETANGTRKYVGYDSPDSTYFLNGPYYGGPGFGEGWNKMKVIPGLYAKTGLRFDYGKYNEIISAIEVGLAAEFYSKTIPQMVYNEEQDFFFSAYVSVLFGKRK